MRVDISFIKDFLPHTMEWPVDVRLPVVGDHIKIHDVTPDAVVVTAVRFSILDDNVYNVWIDCELPS